MDWTAEQLAEMCWATNPHTGRPTKLRVTSELQADYLGWLHADCSHPDVRVVRLDLRNGSQQYREQCLDCGQSFGTPIKKTAVADVGSVPVRSAEERFDYERRRREELDALKQTNVQRQFRAGPGSSEYQEYLKSDSWKVKRAAVMRRANDTCEGCGVQRAVDVHHFTYDNIYNEFLWELAALCRGCHGRLHPGMEVGED